MSAGNLPMGPVLLTELIRSSKSSPDEEAFRAKCQRAQQGQTPPPRYNLPGSQAGTAKDPLPAWPESCAAPEQGAGARPSDP